MNRPKFLLALAWLLPYSAFAAIEPAISLPDTQACRQAIVVAERNFGIPAHLLAAIARVESGRRDPTTARLNPWPWTINMDGQGSFYNQKIDAVIAARAMRSQVTQSIDVGCMQISLTQHPDAFTSLEQAFDPVANVQYGARFLLQLFERTNSWPKAVAYYHSATPDLGDDYQRKVYAAWPAEQQEIGAPPLTALATAWGRTFGRPLLISPLRSIAPHIIPMQPGPAGTVIAGRSLASYRAFPVSLAYRGP